MVATGTHQSTEIDIADQGRSASSHERGASAVEFALLATLLVMLLFGIIEMSRLMFSYSTVWNGAREGARFATTTETASGTPNYMDCAGIVDAAERLVIAESLDSVTVRYLQPPPSTTEVANCQGGPAPIAYDDKNEAPPPEMIQNGYQVEVTVSASFDSVVPLLEVFLDGITLDSVQTRSIFAEVQVKQ